MPSITPTQNDIDIARSGVMIQFNAMFDNDTKKQLEELGIEKFIDYAANRIAHQEAYIRYYANFLHPTE